MESNGRFEEGLEPTPELMDAAAAIRARRDELNELESRAEKQRAVVQAASKELDAAMTTLEAKLTDPEKIRDAKRKTAEAGALLNAEKELLDAIRTAIENARDDVSERAAYIDHATTSIIRGAAQTAETTIRETIYSSMREFMACSIALHGPLGVQGAQYELEMMSKDVNLLKGVDERINTAKRDLRKAME